MRRYALSFRKAPAETGCAQTEDYDYRCTDKHGSYAADIMPCGYAGKGSDDRSTGIKVFDKYVWPVSCHHISDDSAAHSGHHSNKYQQENIVFSVPFQ